MRPEKGEKGKDIRRFALPLLSKPWFTTVMGCGMFLGFFGFGAETVLIHERCLWSWGAFWTCLIWYCSSSCCMRIVLALEHSKASSLSLLSGLVLMSLRRLKLARDILLLHSGHWHRLVPVDGHAEVW